MYTKTMRGVAMIVIANMLSGCGLMFTSGAENIEKYYWDDIPYIHARVMWRIRISCERKSHVACEAFERKMRNLVDKCNDFKQGGWNTRDCEILDTYNTLFKNLPDGSPDPPIPSRTPSP